MDQPMTADSLNDLHELGLIDTWEYLLTRLRLELREAIGLTVYLEESGARVLGIKFCHHYMSRTVSKYGFYDYQIEIEYKGQTMDHWIRLRVDHENFQNRLLELSEITSIISTARVLVIGTRGY